MSISSSSSSSKTVQQLIQQQQNQSKQKYQTLNNNNYDSFDLFLADSFVYYLKKSLGKSKFNRIEKTLCDIFGKTISDCMSSNDSGRVVAVLMSILPTKFKKMTQNIIKKQLFSVSSSSSKKDSKNTVTLHDRNLCNKVLFSYGHRQKKKILDFLRDESIVLQYLQNYLDIPHTTCYRHARELVADGLLVIPPDNKNTYTCMFSNLIFVQSADDNNCNKVQLTIKDEFLESSLLYRLHPFAKKYPKDLRLVVFDTGKTRQ